MLNFKQKPPSISYKGINEWYASVSGQHLAQDIAQTLADNLMQCFGYYAVQIGCSNLAEGIVKKSRVRHQFVIDTHDADALAQYEHLPIANDSVDLVVAAHCLSYCSHPHALLREIDRVLVPDAKLIIIEFNPFSLWGLRHGLQAWLEKMPWTGHLYSEKRLYDWLTILGFKKVKILRAHYDLPIQLKSQNTLTHWLSKATKRWLPSWSAVNILIYEKAITPMTPIKSMWQQKILNGGRVVSPYAGRRSNK